MHYHRGEVAVDEDSQEALEWLSARLKSLLYSVYLQHQPSIKKNKIRSPLKTRLQLCFVPIQTLQLVSVILELCKAVSDYEQFHLLANVLLSLRVDLWAEKMQQVAITVLISLSVLAVSLLALATEAMIVQFRPNQPFHTLLKAVTDWPAIIVHRLLFLPLSLLYLRCVFDGLLALRETEYGEVWLGVLSALGLWGYGGLITLRICFIYENAWHQRGHRLLARPCHAFELKEAAVYLLISLLLALRKPAESSLLVICGLCLYLLFQLVYYQPYYNGVTQGVKSVQYACCAWVCVAAEAALATDTMATAVCLVLFVAPCIAILTCYGQWWRSRAFGGTNGQDFWKYEVNWRRLLVQNERNLNESPLLTHISEGSKRHSDLKQYFLLVAQYYYYHRDLPEVALLRLAMIKQCKGGFLVDFQVNRFANALAQVSKSEEREFVDYESSFSQAKALDLKLCEHTCEVLTTLRNKSTSSEHLQRSFRHLSQLISAAKETYRGLKTRFPSDPFVLESFGSFMESLFHDKAGADLITRGNFEKNRRKKANINLIESYSSDDTGVMIISCAPHSFGKITYANDQLGSILKCKVYDIVGKDLDDFIPSPYNLNHNFRLSHFLAGGEAKEVFRKNLFLSSMGRFSVEVTFRFRPTAVFNVPYFVTAVRQKPKTREFLLFNEKLEITSHSFNFKALVRLPQKESLIGLGLETVLPGVTEKYRYRETDPFVYRSEQGWQVGAMYSQVDLGSQVIRWLYVFSQVRDIEDLFGLTSGEVMSQLRRDLAVFTSSVVSEDKATVTPLMPVEPPIRELSGQGKDARFFNSTAFRDTRDDGSSLAPTHTSFAASTIGFKLRRKALHAVKTYKVAYLLTMLLVTTCLAVSLAIMHTTFSSVMQASNITDLGQSRTELVTICHLVRRLNLILQGQEAKSQQAEVVVSLLSEVGKLQESVDKHFKTGSKQVPVWLLVQDLYEFRLQSLLTALTEFGAHAQFQADAPTAEENNPDFFYIYANGPSSLLKSLNSTITSTLHDMKSTGSAILTLVSTISTGLIAGILLVSSVFVVRSLVQLRSSHSSLWRFVVHLPTPALQDTIRVHQERIECVHGEEYYSQEQTRVKDNPGLLQPPSDYWAIAVKSGVYVVVTTGFLLFMLLFEFVEVRELVEKQVDYLNAKSLTTVLPTLALTLLKEVYISSRKGSGYSTIVQSQVFPALDLEVESVLTTLAWVENQVLSDTSQLSSSGFDLSLMLEDACPYLNSSAAFCPNSALRKGQHEGLLDLRNTALDTLKRVSKGTASWADLAYLEDYVSQLTSITVLSASKAEDYSSAASQRLINEMLAYSCGYMLFSAGLYLLLYLPLVNKMKENCLSVWRVSSLVRRDYAVQGSRQ